MTAIEVGVLGAALLVGVVIGVRIVLSVLERDRRQSRDDPAVDLELVLTVLECLKSRKRKRSRNKKPRK